MASFFYVFHMNCFYEYYVSSVHEWETPFKCSICDDHINIDQTHNCKLHIIMKLEVFSMATLKITCFTSSISNLSSTGSPNPVHCKPLLSNYHLITLKIGEK